MYFGIDIGVKNQVLVPGVGPSDAYNMLANDPTDGMAVSFVDNSMIIRDSVTPGNNYVGTPFPKITFTRTSTATYIDINGILQQAGTGTPRITYDPLTHECLGLLFEESRTNLHIYSQDPTQAVWIKTSATLQAGTGNTPDGTAVGATKLVPSVGAALGSISKSIAFTAAQYTASAYFKSAGHNSFFISIGSAAFTDAITRSLKVNVDPATGIPTGVVVTSGTVDGYRIANQGNGWYRITMIVTCQNAVSANSLFGLGDNTLNDGVNGVYIWGMQAELGSSALSYIPTTTATVSRSNDVNTLLTTLVNFNLAQASLYAEGIIITGLEGNARGLFSVYNSAASNTRHGLYMAANATYGTFTPYIDLVNSGSQQLTDQYPIGSTYQYTLGSTVKMAMASILGSANGAINGIQLSANSAPSVMPNPIDSIRFGRGSINAQFLNGIIRRAMFVPRRMPNNEMILRTQ